MANDLQDLMDTLIMPAALPVLREACVMPALVSTDFGPQAAQQNEVIRVPLPQDMGAADDMNVSTGSASTDLQDPKVDIRLDKWKYKQFQMTDKEMRETITSGVLPSAAEASVKSIANAINGDLWALYKDIPFYAGTPGTTPSDADSIVNTRKVLQVNLAPLNDRRLVMGPDAEAKYLVTFKDADKTGTTAALREASLGRLFGFDTYGDQMAPTHTNGDAATTMALTAGYAAGISSIGLDGASGSATLKAGDILTIAGSGNHVVTANATATTGVFTGVTISPPLRAAVLNDAVVTFVRHASNGNYAVNMAFQRNAFMFAARTLTNENSENSTISVATDPLTGIPLRLETWRDPGKATRYWRFDILYGVKTLRAELATRLLG
jgi:hypothetical protein